MNRKLLGLTKQPPMRPIFIRYHLLVAAAVAAFALTGTATAVAKPAPLYSTAGGWSCTHGASDRTGGSFGSASTNIDGTGSSAAVAVCLRNAAPNTAYELFVMQTISSGCFIPLPFAHLTTNDRGAGSARGMVTIDPAATRRQVLVEDGSRPAFATAL
jgi:hypothetical protein